MENENDVIIPEYLLYEPTEELEEQEPYFLNDDYSFLENSDESLDPSESEPFESYSDYTESLDILNQNIVNLHTSIKFGVGLLFCVVIFLLFKCGFYIFNRILGLGDC